MTKIISLLVAFCAVVPVAAFADIDIDSGYPTPQNSTVEVGEMIEFSVRADTDGSGSDDDWKSTQWDVISDGEGPVCLNDPFVTQDANNIVSSWEYTAVQAGEKTVQVKVYNQPNCNGTERDSASTGLTVTEPVVEEPTPAEQCVLDGGTWNGESCDFPATPEEQCVLDGGTWNGESCDMPSEGGGDSEPAPAQSFSGGGGMCHPNTGYPECQGAANFAFHGLSGGTNTFGIDMVAEQKKILLTQVVQILQQMIYILKSN